MDAANEQTRGKEISAVFSDTHTSECEWLLFHTFPLFIFQINYNQHYFKGKLDVPCQAATFQYF